MLAQLSILKEKCSPDPVNKAVVSSGILELRSAERLHALANIVMPDDSVDGLDVPADPSASDSDSTVSYEPDDCQEAELSFVTDTNSTLTAEQHSVLLDVLDVESESTGGSNAVQPQHPAGNKPKTMSRKRCRKEHEKVDAHLNKYSLRSPCKSCRLKCTDKLTNDNRELINRQYWERSFGERRTWLDAHINIYDVKRRRLTGNVDKEPLRQHSLTYTLPKGTTKTPVCKQMFLRTLGVKTDGIVTEFVKCKNRAAAESVMPTSDRRGKASPPNKVDHVIIRDHINSFHPQVSHYNIQHTPNRRYLDPGLTITSMWKDFQEKHNIPVSYELYRQTFYSENISFSQPQQDECEICCSFNRHSKEVLPDHDAEICDICCSSKTHLERARLARHEYQKPISAGDKVFTADMQKIILLPKLTIKQHFFVSRLVIFNETFASMDGKNDMVILWHEGISGRNAADVTSAYVKCLEMSDSDVVTIWADNCCAQNKNWTLFTAILQCVNSAWGPNQVNIKYLEKGHTYMRADSVHGTIAKKMRSQSEIVNFPDFVALVDSASKTTKPIVLNTNDFYKFTAENRVRQSKTAHPLPLLSSLCMATFRKGSRLLHYKTSFDSDEKQVDFLKPKFKSSSFPQQQSESRGIPLVKKEAILKLLSNVPAGKRKFWLDIPTNDNSSDLVTKLD